MRITVFLLILFTSSGKAQNGPFLFDDQLRYALEDERLRANAVLKRAGIAAVWDEFDSVETDSLKDVRALFNADSIHWSFTKRGIPFSVSVPNDISLLLGGDRVELQDFHLARLREDSRPVEAWGMDTVKVDTLWQRSGLRYEVLQHIVVLDSLDSVPLCHTSYPVASAINSINDTASCNGLYPVSLIFNRYGYKRDTVQTNIASIMRITGAVDWEKWFAVEDEEVTVMLQHPYFAFDHMLFLKLQSADGAGRWIGEMHSFIPSHNLVDLYGKFVQKEGAEQFEIK